MAQARPGLPPGVAVALTGAGFVALTIAGLGMLSLLSDTDVLAVAGLGPLPGAIGTVGAVVAYAVTARAVLHAARPAYAGALIVAVATLLAYLAGVVVGGVFAGVDLARLAAAAGSFATSWFAVVLASAALVCGWGAVALVRTRADPPHWPWERREP